MDPAKHSKYASAKDKRNRRKNTRKYKANQGVVFADELPKGVSPISGGIAGATTLGNIGAMSGNPAVAGAFAGVGALYGAGKSIIENKKIELENQKMQGMKDAYAEHGNKAIDPKLQVARKGMSRSLYAQNGLAVEMEKGEVHAQKDPKTGKYSIQEVGETPHEEGGDDVVLARGGVVFPTQNDQDRNHILHLIKKGDTKSLDKIASSLPKGETVAELGSLNGSVDGLVDERNYDGGRSDGPGTIDALVAQLNMAGGNPATGEQYTREDVAAKYEQGDPHVRMMAQEMDLNSMSNADPDTDLGLMAKEIDPTAMRPNEAPVFLRTENNLMKGAEAWQQTGQNIRDRNSQKELGNIQRNMYPGRPGNNAIGDEYGYGGGIDMGTNSGVNPGTKYDFNGGVGGLPTYGKKRSTNPYLSADPTGGGAFGSIGAGGITDNSKSEVATNQSITGSATTRGKKSGAYQQPVAGITESNDKQVTLNKSISEPTYGKTPPVSGAFDGMDSSKKKSGLDDGPEAGAGSTGLIGGVSRFGKHANSIYNLARGLEGPEYEKGNFVDLERHKYTDNTQAARQAARRAQKAGERQINRSRTSRGQSNSYKTQNQARYLNQQDAIDSRAVDHKLAIEQANVDISNKEKLINNREKGRVRESNYGHSKAQKQFIGAAVKEAADKASMAERTDYMKSRDAKLDKRNDMLMKLAGTDKFAFDAAGNLQYTGKYTGASTTPTTPTVTNATENTVATNEKKSITNLPADANSSVDVRTISGIPYYTDKNGQLRELKKS